MCVCAWQRLADTEVSMCESHTHIGADNINGVPNAREIEFAAG